MAATFAARVLQDILDIVHAQPVFGNVLDVAFRVVKIVPQERRKSILISTSTGLLRGGRSTGDESGSLVESKSTGGAEPPPVAHFCQQTHTASRACLRSAMMSDTSSVPIDNRTKSGVTPVACCSSAVNC